MKNHSLRIVCIFAFLSILYTVPMHTQYQKGNLDLVTVVDLSKSMVGAGGAVNIFSKVQQTAKDIVGELKENDTYTLITFGEKINIYPTVTLHDQQDRDRIYELINELRASQNWTYTSSALRSALQEAQRLDKIFQDHKKLIFILTDGINDPPPNAIDRGISLEDVATPYAKKGWFVYQVQYGETVDKHLDTAIKKVGDGGTIQDQGVSGGIEKLRPIIQKQKSKQSWMLSAKRISIVIDRLNAPSVAEIPITLPASIQIKKSFIVINRNNIPSSVLLDGEFVLQAEERYVVKITSKATELIPNDTYQGIIRFDAQQESIPPLEIELLVHTEMVPAVWPYYLAGVLFLIGVVASALFIIKQWRLRKLFGKLVFTTATTNEKKTFDDIAEWGHSAIIGSEKCSVPTLSNAARVYTKKVDGNIMVVLERLGDAKIIFGGKTVVDITLYDGDEFKINSIDCKYSGSTGRRPRFR